MPPFSPSYEPPSDDPTAHHVRVLLTLGDDSECGERAWTSECRGDAQRLRCR